MSFNYFFAKIKESMIFKVGRHTKVYYFFVLKFPYKSFVYFFTFEHHK